VHRGWDRQTYTRPDHPLQQEVLSLVAEMAGVPRERIQIATDGCGVPTFALPLASVAVAFARLVGEPPVEHGRAAEQVVTAMLAHPEMVAGSSRFDTELML